MMTYLENFNYECSLVSVTLLCIPVFHYQKDQEFTGGFKVVSVQIVLICNSSVESLKGVDVVPLGTRRRYRCT